MAELSLELPAVSKRDTRRLTDWVELMMLIEGHESVSDVEIRDRLQQIGSGEEIGEEEEDEGDAIEVPFMGDVEDIMREVERRRSDAPDAYPFERDGDRLMRVEGLDPPLYLFLLLLSIEHTPFREETWSTTVGPLFDYVGEAALLAMLGSGARSLRFGWPIHAGDGRPTGPRQALEWLAAQMGLVHEGSAKIKKQGKDMGVDVVLWRPFPDGQPGFVVLLAQCTVSSREWSKSKIKDISRKLWTKYLGLGYEPLTALVVPFAVSEREDIDEWDVMQHHVSMILDRMRLASLLRPLSLQDVKEHAAITSQIASWRATLEL